MFYAATTTLTSAQKIRGKLGYRREGHREIDGITKVRNGHGGPELDWQARHDRCQTCQHAAYSRLSLVQTWLKPSLLCKAVSASPISSGRE
jgi:hypothetical protein